MKFPGASLALSAGFLLAFSTNYLAFSFSFAPSFGGGIDISENTQRDVGSMVDWATGYGVQQADGFEVTSYDGVDFFAATQSGVAAGSPVLFVPSDLIFTASKSVQEFGDALSEAEYQLANGKCADKIPLFRIFIKILVEYQKGQDSPWYPYLNSMPRRFNNGAAMTFACFDVLPPYAAWLAMTERANSVNFQKGAKAVPILRDEIKRDTNLLKWAYNVATTRAMELNGEKVLVPMADMFHHGLEVSVDLSLDPEGNVMATATRDVQAGSPLLISLGDPTNPSPMFARYGFLDDSSPATFCKCMHLMDEMQQLGYGFGDLLFYKTGEITPAVYDVFLYEILQKNDPDNVQGFYDAVMNSDEETKQQYHSHYYEYTKGALNTHVDNLLRELDELASKARSYDPVSHPRVPIVLAHNEFVKQTFLAVKSKLQSM